MDVIPDNKSSSAAAPVKSSGAAPKMARRRSALNCAPGEKFTVRRGEAKAAENLYLTDLFCEWLNSIRTEDEPVLNPEDFIDQLSDGVMLCRILSQIDPSKGTLKYHLVADNLFKKQENLSLFQQYATDFLRFPVCFDPSDFKNGNIGNILSCLLYVAKVAEKAKSFNTVLPEDLKTKVDAQPDIAEMTWWEWLYDMMAKGYQNLIVEPLARVTGAAVATAAPSSKEKRRSSSKSTGSRRSSTKSTGSNSDGNRE